MSIHFSNEELQRVPEAITSAEAGTSAEIFAVLARRSDDYRFVGYAFAALWIFLFSGLIGLWVLWRSSQTADWGNGTVLPWFENLPLFILAQILAFVCIVLVLRLVPRLGVAITPRRIRDERARANGIKQFLAHGVHQTGGRSGLLVFVSLEERYGEIFVDAAIEKALGRDFLLEEIRVLVESCAEGRVIDGYVAVIGQLGERLAVSFPINENDENELVNRFVIL